MMDTEPAPQTPTVDLTNCDREPIHIPGSIQPHGCLLACDAAGRTVLRHSANAIAMLGLDGPPNDRPVAQVLGDQIAHDLANVLSFTAEGHRPAMVFAVSLPTGAFDVTLHRHLGHTIIEFEPAQRELGTTLSIARTVIGRLRSLHTVERLIARAAGLIQAQLGYDRVMIYELGADGAGKVVSEAKTHQLESFRGQYFPASDIPQQARALYLKNPIRLIGDAGFTPVPLVPQFDHSGEPLDLSHSHLRSVSPIHCEYLRNMGVGASMSISIIVEGQLWGLIACHHYAPKILSMADRSAAEMVGEFFSLHLDALLRKKALDAARTARKALDDLLVDASRSEDISAALRARLPSLQGLIPSDGVALWFDDEWSGTGHFPDRDAALPLIRLAMVSPEAQIRASHQLAALLPDATALTASVAGALIIPLSQRPRDFLIFFRKQAVQTLDWAGDPNKTYETGPLGDRLTPRKSFAIWKETVRDKAQPWSETDRQFAEAIRLAVVEVLLHNGELLADERERAALRQRVLNEELNHRVKNILAVIRSLVSQQPQSGETLASYIEALRGRIQALALAHDQVVRGDGGGSLSELLSAELGPYSAIAHSPAGGDLQPAISRMPPPEATPPALPGMAEPPARVALSGPPVTLDARAYSVMALVLHELATNAAKYGALSHRDGRLSVSWDLEPTGTCRIRWQESGGPEVKMPQRRGFGSTLIERSVPFDLGGEAEVRYDNSGLVANFVLPSRFVRASAEPAEGQKAETKETGVTIADLDGKRVMLVEDQMIIAMALEEELQDEGLQVCGVVPGVAAALALIEAENPDLAVLDINLGRETSLPVAEALRVRGIPFVFASGYGSDFALPAHLSATPIVNKPYDVAEVIRSLKTAVARG